MDRGEWIGRLELLHERARRRGPFSVAEREWYERARGALTATALSVQRRTLAGGERARTSLRLERAVPVRVEGPGWAVHASTSDLGTGGFAVLMEAAPAPEQRAQAVLELPAGDLAVEVRVVGAVGAGDLQRVSLAFEHPAGAVVSAVEDTLLDQLLPELVFWDEVLARIPW
jgi:hypothetical protein